VDNELEVIRHQMEHTRSSLADKIEALETEFRGTVEGATSAVANTVETVQETVANVKESVQETVETVRESLDVRKHVERHPWAMFGGAVAVGWVAGYMFGGRGSRRPKPAEATPPPLPTVRNGAEYRNGASRKAAAADEESGPLHSSFQALKGLAVGTLMGVLRDVLVQAVPSNLASDLAGVVDDMTTKLGGKPLRRNDDANESGPGEGEAHHDESSTSEVGRSVGATRWSR